ncbi:MAG TPA: glutamate synthase large subunit [Candidatus Acidoferrales bacterium]|nr:glutamate synthase large subunit [Candidatus Acidoferrales bacterium]
MSELYPFRGVPPAQGLYNPQHEHDACGIGFVASIEGRKSHDIVTKGVQILINLAHRGACGCDPQTGDGAGILIQIPHAFFEREAVNMGFSVPGPGEYGVGMVFLPVDTHDRLICEGIIEKIVREEGLAVLGWRDTPINGNTIGRLARASQPYIEQIFVRSAPGMDQDSLERKLYVIRKRTEAEILATDLKEKEFFYIPSLSSRTIIYKGLLLAPQITDFYKELLDPDVTSALCLVHQRFSTNTFPSWKLAHPYRYICHNGEINTLRGNMNWMYARQSVLQSPLFGDDIKKLLPVITAGGSDSAMLDNAVELLTLSGRSLPHVMSMLIPEAWDHDDTMPEDIKAFYEYHASLMEPWDGPAAVAFTDGRVIGAKLDRNGLRPGRFLVTNDGLVVLASEAGVLPIKPEDVRLKGRLAPGRIFLVDTEQKRLITDEEVKKHLAARRPYAQWLKENQITLDHLPSPTHVQPTDHDTIRMRQRAFGYTDEDLKTILLPSALNGEEPVGSMGIDTPLACLSDKPQMLFNYFKQTFAQVTNPAIDSIREGLVMSLNSYIGSEGNILEETPKNCHTLKLRHPVISNWRLEKLRRVSWGSFLATSLPMLFRVSGGEQQLEESIENLCRRASLAIKSGYTLLILTDRGVDHEYAPIPSLLAMSAVHNHLIREGTRNQVALIVESGEPREVMHFALLLGYGASAVNPYLAIETLEDLHRSGAFPADTTWDKVFKSYMKSIDKGLLKTFSKMGISTLQSYQGAQIFESIGLDKSLVEKYFTGTSSRIQGVGIEVLAREAIMKHDFAMQPPHLSDTELRVGGEYQYRVRGERHLLNPTTVSKLQHAVRQEKFESFREFADIVNQQNRDLQMLRGMFDFKPNGPAIPLDQVEPASEIVKRFATGAMSFGSISKEAHETLAVAMNRIGGKSNTGEGGEDEARFTPGANGDLRRSAIKQVASARFGVTTNYLINADDLQIKIAQGAKPGEGGQLPGHKVDDVIARVRHSIPGVGLISPPPHHDIYSIEDLAQLIFDLKNVNPQARISVKLVAEVGVGTVAAGVAKAHADVILISGYDGGTGASPVSSIRHAGIPWELGLSETQQVLVLNDLRSRVRLQVDGKLQTGRDVAVGALLGAEEFGFATTPLIAMGCIMMRKCHLNTCPVGVATQDPELRKKFSGQPEHVINFLFYVAEDLRLIMAELGFRKMDEMIGRVDCLVQRKDVDHWKAKSIDLSSVLYNPPMPSHVGRRCTQAQDHGLSDALDGKMIEQATDAIERLTPVSFNLPIRNVHRTVGAMLSGRIARKHGSAGLPDETVRIQFHGCAGQSFGAFLSAGVSLTLEGEANDYVGKGLSGGRIVIYPPRNRNSQFVPEENILVGNVCLYGATSGEAFFNGMAGERFAVRNSGATAVVEGVGDHGCEYMTRGLVVVLGKTGRNFAAGMTGGIAYVLDQSGEFAEASCNRADVDLEPVTDTKDIEVLHRLVTRHAELTDSPQGQRILKHWDSALSKFVKVFPHEYKRVLGVPRIPATVVAAQAGSAQAQGQALRG